MNQFIAFATMALVLLSGCPLAGSDAEVSAALDTHLRRYGESNRFMGAVLVARRGVVLLDRAYGYADAEWLVDNTTDTKFRIGSMSKQFTAAAVLLLEQQGKLTTEDRLSRYVPDVPADWAPITLHQLLTHTSGIPELVRSPDYPVLRTQPSTPEKMYRMVRDKPLDFPPGARFQYSNSGYVLLALVVERVTGTSFDEAVRARVWAPLALSDTGGDRPRPLMQRRAHGYVPLYNGVELDPAAPLPLALPPLSFRNCDFIDMSVPTGAGSIYSTTHDLLRWSRALFAGQILSPASLAKMTTAYNETSGVGYGYGLFVGRKDGLRRIGHGGSVHGFLSWQTYFPDSDVLVVVLSNLTGGQWVSEVAEGLANIANGLPPGMRGDAAAIDARRD